VSPPAHDVQISVVTPSYNQARYLERTIRSILDQDYPNVEYIVMDGGSTDGSVEILERYGDRLTWRSERDGGQTDAINKGLAVATGEILSYVNSDDVVLPGAFRTVVDAYRRNPGAGLIYGNGYFCDADDRYLRPYHNEAFDMERLRECCYICQPAAYFTRRALQAVGGRFDATLVHVMDYDMWIRIAKRFPVVHLPQDLAMLRIYPECKTMADRINVHAEALQLVRREFPGRVSSTWCYAMGTAITEERKMNGPRTASPAQERRYVRHFVIWSAWAFLRYYRRIPLRDLRYLGGVLRYYASLLAQTRAG
jgi:glycosyltransferase involved in cell wall biosynthesis